MSKEEIAAQLQQFLQDPRGAASQFPVKQVVQAGSTQAIPTLFSPEQVRSGQYVADRDSYRKLMCTERQGQRICLDQVLPGRAPFQQNDLVENLVDVPAAQILRRLEDMEQRNLLSAQLDETPWSSTYWPICQGGLGARYADPQFPGATDWQQNQTYIQQNPTADIIKGGDAAAIDLLSPAEKYDFLVGDQSFSLTGAVWDEGRHIIHAAGKVETWHGICHGWAPAAYMVPRPLYKAKMTAADGKTQIVFYPADIKALASLLWAKTRPNLRFIGGRCNDKDPARDPNGRILSQDCFDTNPGTWHMGIVNQIGIARRSFVLDATYDYEVWNQPAFGYSYSYFNPQTGQPVDSLADAIVARADFGNDKFSQYRAKDTRFFAGISMDLTYVVETVQNHQERNGPGDDAVRKVGYLYDLELDADHKILGGEWYRTAHPDFMWTPPPAGRALSAADFAATGDWSGSGPLPATWLSAAVTAARLEQPLAKLVDVLVNFAQ